MEAVSNTSYTDYGLLLAIVLGSSYIFNKGSIWPKRDPFQHLLFEKPQKQHGTTPSARATRDIGEKVRDSEARFAILWGSQSGTAEGLANRLARDFQQRLKTAVVVGDLSDYNPETIANVPESVTVVLVMSTFGEGDPSDNAQALISYLATPPIGVMSHVKFAAFGCGNSSYRYFNKVIYDAASGMERSGATLILPVGVGDEATRSTHEDFLGWKEELISLLVAQHGFSDSKPAYQPTTAITMEGPSSDSSSDQLEDTSVSKGLVHLPITTRQTVAQYADEKRTCIDVKLDITRHGQIKYRTGDHIAIWPSNSKAEADLLLRVLGRESQRDHRLRIEPIDELSERKVPRATTLESLFLQHLDICAPVSRETVLTLAQLAPSAKTKIELERLGKDRDTYADFLDHNYLTLARLMELMNIFDPDNSWTSLPLAFVLDFVPAMQPRLYSISTSSIVEPRQVGIVVSVKPGTVRKRPEAAIHGVASTYLSTAQVSLGDVEGDAALVRAEIRRSSFKLPFNPATPVLMVAAGTGIAPFRAFIHERARLASIGRAVGPMLLFFGCQNTSDCLFFDELTDIASKHASTFELKIVTAFSRPRDEAGGSQVEKAYVQDKVSQHSQEVLRYMLEKDAALYLCGATAMAKAVGDVILKAAAGREQWSAEAADKWRQAKRRGGRWHEDVWS